MDLGENIMLLRKKKGLSQNDLGKIIGTSGDVIGRYERSNLTPSIDVVTKIADALEVSIDYLTGKSKIILDKDMLDRMENISNLSEENKNYIISLIDMALRDFKTQQTYK